MSCWDWEQTRLEQCDMFFMKNDICNSLKGHFRLLAVSLAWVEMLIPTDDSNTCASYINVRRSSSKQQHNNKKVSITKLMMMKCFLHNIHLAIVVNELLLLRQKVVLAFQCPQKLETSATYVLLLKYNRCCTSLVGFHEYPSVCWYSAAAGGEHAECNNNTVIAGRGIIVKSCKIVFEGSAEVRGQFGEHDGFHRCATRYRAVLAIVKK